MNNFLKWLPAFGAIFVLGMVAGAAIMRPPDLSWILSAPIINPGGTSVPLSLSGRPTVTPIPNWWEVMGPLEIQRNIDSYVTTTQDIRTSEIDGIVSVNKDLAIYFTKAYLVREVNQGTFTAIPVQLKRGYLFPNLWTFTAKDLVAANYQIVVELQFGQTLVKKGEWFRVP